MERSIGEAADPAEVEVVEPDGEVAAAFHAGGDVESGELAGVAVALNGVVATAARRIERAFHLIAIEAKVQFVREDERADDREAALLRFAVHGGGALFVRFRPGKLRMMSRLVERFIAAETRVELRHRKNDCKRI
jgi:hypothetical protein